MFTSDFVEAGDAKRQQVQDIILNIMDYIIDIIASNKQL